jgi:hypothetical protein
MDPSSLTAPAEFDDAFGDDLVGDSSGASSNGAAWPRPFRIWIGPGFRVARRLRRCGAPSPIKRTLPTKTSAKKARSVEADAAMSAATGGDSERAIMTQTGLRSTDMVSCHIREANLFDSDNSASLAGLLQAGKFRALYARSAPGASDG